MFSMCFGQHHSVSIAMARAAAAEGH
uniref:Uncharacterized protein n=2 Tax=Anguilla anguilla TaxID=7936 RepID=A0A0E9U9L8_ANGAN